MDLDPVHDAARGRGRVREREPDSARLHVGRMDTSRAARRPAGTEGYDRTDRPDGGNRGDRSAGPTGATGPVGGTGPQGSTTLISQLSESPGTNCSNGGTKIESGADTNSDGTLEPSEVTATSYVCSGAPGDPGAPGTPGTLIVVTPEPPGPNCANGGVRIDSGTDANRNQGLDSNEITKSAFVCNSGSGPGSTPNPIAGGEGLSPTAGSCETDTSCGPNYFCNQGTCDLKAVQVAVGPPNGTSSEFSACALLFNGTVQCWVYTAANVRPSGRASGLDGAVSIAYGGAHIGLCAVLADGTVKCGPLSSTRAVPGLSGVTGIASGVAHGCALKSDGTVWCWGDNTLGQLGDGTEGGNSPNPVQTLVTNATAIASGPGSNHTCALLATRTVSCWGDDSQGQLGDGTTSSSPTPRTVPVVDAISVSVGGVSSCATLANRSGACWGKLGGTGGIPFLGFPNSVTVTAGGSLTQDRKPAVDFTCPLSLAGTSCNGLDATSQRAESMHRAPSSLMARLIAGS